MATPDQAIEAIRATGGAQPGNRALHAKGKLYRGTFTATQPRFVKALPVVKEANKIPAGYGTVAYRGLHAFRWIAADGSARFVPYHLVPDAGEDFLPPDVAKTNGPDFLVDELDNRLAAQPVRFHYQVQVTARGDSTVDPSKPWQGDQVGTVGTLENISADTEREHGGDIVVFDPMRVTDGIEPSDEPALHFRSAAYSASVKLRSGVGRGPEAPAT